MLRKVFVLISYLIHFVLPFQASSVFQHCHITGKPEKATCTLNLTSLGMLMPLSSKVLSFKLDLRLCLSAGRFLYSCLC